MPVCLFKVSTPYLDTVPKVAVKDAVTKQLDRPVTYQSPTILNKPKINLGLLCYDAASMFPANFTCQSKVAFVEASFSIAAMVGFRLWNSTRYIALQLRCLNGPF